MKKFFKLYSSILYSNLWQESKETKVLWITLLAMSDEHGMVDACIPALAKRAGLTLDECEASLKVLLSPDPYSSCKDEDGRRILEIDGGWLIVNHGKTGRRRGPLRMTADGSLN